jgi:hypothetical protein
MLYKLRNLLQCCVKYTHTHRISATTCPNFMALQTAYSLNHEKRYQRVSVSNDSLNENTFCNWRKVNCYVPQGSILGPMFLIYIHDLPKILLKINLNGSYEITLFADDTSLIVNNPNRNIFENYINMIFFKKIMNGLIPTYH